MFLGKEKSDYSPDRNVSPKNKVIKHHSLSQDVASVGTKVKMWLVLGLK
jgi:hypothetical protein